MLNYLREASQIAKKSKDNLRNYILGCIGIREDGAIVSSINGAARFSKSVDDFYKLPNSHAEGRVLRKLGRNGIMFVARVHKKDGTLAMALPCSMCQTRIKAFKVKKVYFTCNEEQYGIWSVKEDQFRFYDF